MQQDPLNTPQSSPEEGSEATGESPSRESQWLDIVSHPALPLSPRFDPENETEMETAMPSAQEVLSPAVEPLPALLTSEPLPLVPMSLLRAFAILALTAIFLIPMMALSSRKRNFSPAPTSKVACSLHPRPLPAVRHVGPPSPIWTSTSF